MMTKLLLSWGITRDSKLWSASRWMSLLMLVASGQVDVIGLGDWLGIHMTPVMSHWCIAIAVVLLWLAGNYDASTLPGKPTIPKE